VLNVVLLVVVVDVGTGVCCCDVVPTGRGTRSGSRGVMIPAAEEGLIVSAATTPGTSLLEDDSREGTHCRSGN